MNQKENIQLPSWPIQKNIDLLAERERFGLTKYGVTLGDASLSHEALLQHALEEALDLSNYLQTALATERENEKWLKEHRLLMEKLQAHGRLVNDQGRFKDFDAVNAFKDMMLSYSIDACRRDVWVTP